MLSSKLYSHSEPEKLLETHLVGVARLTELFLLEKPPSLRQELSKIAHIIALTHDIGKATTSFQTYLFANEKDKQKLKSLPRNRHSMLSAIVAYFLTKTIEPDSLRPFYAFLCVRRHHGDLHDVRDEVLLFDDKLDLLKEQLKDIEPRSFSILSQILFNAGAPILLSQEIIELWISEFPNELKQDKKRLRNLNGNLSSYIEINLLFSLLLDSDKSDVVIHDASVFVRNELASSQFVDNYKKAFHFPDSPINRLREMAYRETIDSHIDFNTHIYSLNLPTGLGKTLTALSYALKLSDALKKRSIHPRIIYALPFLSIIDQNAHVFENVLDKNNIKPTSDRLLKHHHLSDLTYSKDNIEYETNEAKILIEGWNSDMIITTFVQLFHTLISNRNKSLRKFHRLANSIIILDEIQSIPIKYWRLTRAIFNEISIYLNTYIILVTATEPLIFDKNEIKPLLNSEFYFNSMDRLTLIPDLSHTTTIQELYDSIDFNNNKTYLFIMNTISSAQALYQLIQNNEQIKSTYLSTHITPIERLKRINEIKQGYYQAVVSTQLVEAGVDIDFDVVIRDIAPLDSINQAAGRCNRNNHKKGEVRVVKLISTSGKKYAASIYDPVLLDITERILSAKIEIKEHEFLSLVEQYYQETKDKTGQSKSKEILEAVQKLRYDSEDNQSIADFKLIQEDYHKVDVFVQIDNHAVSVWDSYIQLREKDDLFERKLAFDAIKGEFYQYVIAIPASASTMLEPYGDLRLVSYSSLNEFYDSKTGFMTNTIDRVHIW